MDDKIAIVIASNVIGTQRVERVEDAQALSRFQWEAQAAYALQSIAIHTCDIPFEGNSRSFKS